MIFRHLLRTEFRNGSALALSLGLAVATGLVFLPWEWGSLAVLAIITFAVAMAFALMRRTPWCSHEAFWRTRPVTPGMLWTVRSVALLALTLLPVAVVMLAALSGFGASTVWRGMGLLGGAVLLAGGATAAVVAIASKGRGWGALAVTLTVLPAFVVGGVVVPAIVFSRMAVSRSTERIQFEQGQMLTVIVVSLLVVAALAWLAWLSVGRWRRWKLALVILAAGSALWPLLAGSLGHVFYRAAARDAGELRDVSAYSLEVSRDGLLRMPLQVVDLPADEIVVPRALKLQSEMLPEKRRTYEAPMSGDAGGRRLQPGEPIDVFENEHSSFAARVDLEGVWRMLRDQVPAHEQWIESDPGSRSPHEHFELPGQTVFEDPDLAATLTGDVYRFRKLAEISTVKRQRICDSSGRLRLVSAGASTPSVIDIRFRWVRPAAGLYTPGDWLDGSSAPEMWGILYHPPSKTAYAAASLRESRPNHGPAALLIHRADLVLRFQLPEIETALLGLEAKKVLAESTLYLFAAEHAGTVRAQLTRNGPE